MLAQHTLIIPTYNRPDLLWQLVSFYQNEAPQMKLLVLDSSTAEAARVNQERLVGNDTSLVYRRYTSTTPMAEKLAQGLGEVTTPTVSFCADDDVVFPHAINQSVDFLNQAHDYVCSHGIYLVFRLSVKKVRTYIEYAGASNIAHYPGARIFRLCQNYESLFYAVFRTHQLQQVFAVVQTIPSLHFQEFFQSVGSLILGKVNRFPDFYAARRIGPEAEPGREKWQTYYWFADDTKDMLSHYSDYRKQAFLFYEKMGSMPILSEHEFQRVFDLAHTVYFSANCPPSYFHSRLHDLWPGDSYLHKQVDLLDGLRRDKSGRLSSRILTFLFYVQKLAQHADHLPPLRYWQKYKLNKMNQHVALNYDAGRHKKPWRCVLTPDRLWLADTQPFREGFSELCRYLDCASRPKA